MTTEELAPDHLPMAINLKITLKHGGKTKVIEHNLKLVKWEIEDSQGQNRTASDEIEVTEKGLEAFKTFASLAKTRLLNKGLRSIFLSAMNEDIWGAIWFDEFKEELKTLYDFLDDLDEEYGEPR